MPDWGIKLEGQDKPYPLDDLTPKEVQGLAKRYGMSWFDVIQTPAADLDLLADLIDLVAGKLGVDKPGRQSTMTAARKQLDLLVTVEAEIPSQWDEAGNPPMADETTSISSGSPENTGGVPT